MSGIFESGPDVAELRVVNPYFSSAEPLRFDDAGSYASPEAVLEHRATFTWSHTLSEVINSLIGAGLGIEFVHEFPFSIEKWFAFMERRDDGLYHMTKHAGSVPMLFSIKATKPG